jgi:hypothetical protein
LSINRAIITENNKLPRISRAREIEQRRMAVLELVSKGYSQTEVADKLNYSKSCISNDVRILKESAKRNFKRIVEHELPFQHRIAEAGLQYVKRQASAIADKTNDERIKIGALQLFKEVDSDLYALHNTAEVLNEAIEYVQARKEELKHLQEHDQFHEDHDLAGREGFQDPNAVF